MMISVPVFNSLRSLPSHIAPLPSMMYWISSVLGWMCLGTLPDCMPTVPVSVTTRPLACSSGLGVAARSACLSAARSIIIGASGAVWAWASGKRCSVSGETARPAAKASVTATVTAVVEWRLRVLLGLLCRRSAGLNHGVLNCQQLSGTICWKRPTGAGFQLACEALNLLRVLAYLNQIAVRVAQVN